MSHINQLKAEEHSDVRRSMDSVSHGRGGAGNIGHDDTPYVDGEIVREGYAGDRGDGAFSTGRGGAANIGGSPKVSAIRTDHTAIPEVALRPSSAGDHHVGRGGAGNEEHVHKSEGKHKEVGLADKLKNKLFKKKTEST